MSVQEVFEGAKVKIRVKLHREGRKDEDTARLIIQQDGGTIQLHTLTVKKNWIEKELVVPKVPDDKESYMLTWRVDHATGVEGMDKSVRVWPKDCKVKLVDDQDAGVKDVAFRLKFTDGHVARFESGDGGERECSLTRKAQFVVEVDGPGKLQDFKPGKEVGRDRQAIVTTWKAEIYAPEEPVDSPAKQYVNLVTERTGDEIGHDGQGHLIRFVVGPEGKKDDAPGRRVGNTTKLYVRVTLDDMTKRSKDLPKLLEVEDFSRSAKKLTGKVLFGDDGTAKFTLRLGRGGGEKCKIEVGLTKSYGEGEREYINWRKIWVEPAAPAGRAVEVDAAITALESVFIEGVKTADTTLNPGAVAGSTIPSAELGCGAGDVLIIGDHNEHSFRGQIRNEHDGLTAYAMFCDLQIDGGRAARWIEGTFTAEAADSVAFNGGGNTAGCSLSAGAFRAFDEDDELLLPRCVHDGNASATAEWCDDTGTWHAFDAGDVKVLPTATNAPGRVHIRYPVALVNELANGDCPFRVRINPVSETFNGWAPNGTTGVVIALRHLDKERTAAEYQKTVVHEIGHQLQQLRGTVPDGLLRITHGRYYTGRGHSGGHCADGIAALKYLAPGKLTGRDDATCVMYGEGSDSRPIDFCKRCKPFVLAEPVERLG